MCMIGVPKELDLTPPHSRNTPWVEEEEEGFPSQVHTIGLKEGYIVVESVKTVQDTNG